MLEWLELDFQTQLGLNLCSVTWSLGQLFIELSGSPFSQLENWNDTTSLLKLWGGVKELTCANCLARCQLLEKFPSPFCSQGCGMSSKAVGDFLPSLSC